MRNESFQNWKSIKAQCSNLTVEQAQEFIELEKLKQLMRIGDVLEQIRAEGLYCLDSEDFR